MILVGRNDFDPSQYLSSGLVDLYIDEESPNLAEKINLGFRHLPPEVTFINWLGDDDQLTPNSLIRAVERLEQADSPVMVFGGCEYVDSGGRHLFTNRSGQWAAQLLAFGPQLIPQPGSLYRRDAFNLVGELNTSYSFAFDFHLFQDLKRLGKLVFLPFTLSRFRWHPESLSVSRRRESVLEASKVRRSFLPRYLRYVSFLWEFPVRVLTQYSGWAVSRKARKPQKSV